MLPKFYPVFYGNILLEYVNTNKPFATKNPLKFKVLQNKILICFISLVSITFQF
jgi:hypothetical protein